MKNKNVRLLFFLFLLTLMAISGAASFFASEENLYRGLETIKPEDLSSQASLLNIPLPSGTADFSKVAKENEKRLNRVKPQQTPPVETQNIEMIEVENQTPCGETGIPIISDSTIVGCKFE